MISEPEMEGEPPLPPREGRGPGRGLRDRRRRRRGVAAGEDVVPPGSRTAGVPAPREGSWPADAAWTREAGDTAGPGDVPDPDDLVDADGPLGPATLVGDALSRLGPRRTALMWALAGACAASAAWVVGLAAYHQAGPDLRGYHATGDLCSAAHLSALGELLGPRGADEPASSQDAAADQSTCEVQMGPAPAGGPVAGPRTPLAGERTTRSVVDVVYVLHRRTDPGPEFAATLDAPDPGGAQHAARVPGLGENAYLVTDAAGGPPLLKVLDGQAVLSIQVTSYTYFAHPPGEGSYGGAHLPQSIDPDVLEPALVADMRDLMGALRD